MCDSLRRTGLLAGRNVKEILREPLSLVFLLALPLLMEVAFYYLFHDLTSQFQMKYLAPGIVVFSQAFLTLFTGLLLSMDRGGAFLTRLFVSPAKPYEFIFGYALALLPVVLIQSFLFFLAGGLIDPSVFGWGMVKAAALSLIPSLFFVGVGILFGALCPEKSVGGVSAIIITGQSVLSGMWFPTEKMSGGFLTVMKCLPFKNATDLIQNVMNGVSDPANDFWRPLAIVLAYAAVSFLAAILVFRRKMRAD